MANYVGLQQGIGAHLPSIANTLSNHFRFQAAQKDKEGADLRQREEEQFGHVLMNLQAEANKRNTSVTDLLKQDDAAFQTFMSVAPVATRDALKMTNRELVDWRGGLEPFEVNPGQYALAVRRKDGGTGVITRGGTDGDDDPAEVYDRAGLVDQIFKPAIVKRGLNNLTEVVDVALGGIEFVNTPNGPTLSLTDANNNPIPQNSEVYKRVAGQVQQISQATQTDPQTVVGMANRALAESKGARGGGSGGGSGGLGDIPNNPMAFPGATRPMERGVAEADADNDASVRMNGLGDFYSPFNRSSPREVLDNAGITAERMQPNAAGQRVESALDSVNSAPRTAWDGFTQWASDRKPYKTNEEARANGWTIDFPEQVFKPTFENILGKGEDGEATSKWLPKTPATSVSADSQFDDSEPVSSDLQQMFSGEADPLAGTGKVPLSGDATIGKGVLRQNPARVISNPKYTLAQQATATALFYKSTTGTIPANLLELFRPKSTNMTLEDQLKLAKSMVDLERARVGLQQDRQKLKAEEGKVDKDQEDKIAENNAAFLDSGLESLLPKLRDPAYSENEDAAIAKAKYQFTATVSKHAAFLANRLGIPFDSHGSIDMSKTTIPQLTVLMQMVFPSITYDGQVEKGGWFTADQVKDQFGQMDLSMLPASDPRISQVNARLDQLRREDPENFGRMVSAYIYRDGEQFWLDSLYQDVAAGTAPSIILEAIQ